MTTIVNLTPHAITLGEIVFPPSGTIARAGEWVETADPIRASIPDPTGAPADRLDHEIPTSWVTYTRLEDLPDPTPDTYYVVSLIVAQAAAALHRSTADLLTPGEQVRDDKGRVIGCKSLARVGRGIPTFKWHAREAFVAECLRQGGSSDVGAEREPGHLGRYARQYSSALTSPTTIASRPNDQATFYCTTRKGRGVHLTGVPFSTLDEMDAAYALLARAGATCNDARDAEKVTARSAVAASLEALAQLRRNSDRESRLVEQETPVAGDE